MVRRLWEVQPPKPLEDGGAPWYHEVVGTAFFVACMWAVTGVLSWLWAVEYAIPSSQLSAAECLVLSSEMQTSPTGFQRAPLYRAVVEVYLFNSSVAVPNCTEAGSIGSALAANASNATAGPAPARCNEVLGTAYDSLTGKYTMHEKTDFLRRWGHPGNFYPCLHSSDLATVIFERDINTVFLMAPIVAFCVGAYAVAAGVLRVVRRRRRGRYQAVQQQETRNV